MLSGMRCGVVFGMVLLGLPSLARAQGDHQHGQHGPATAPPEVAKSGESPTRDAHLRGPLGTSAARMGSGTGWLPDESEMRALHASAAGFNFMLHFNAFGGYNYQTGDRGDQQAFSANWIMGMAQRHVLGGDLEARVMLSLEPLTIGARGYPLLLQTGESYQGQPLVDRQHPHDLFMETALMYTRPITETVAVQVYGGPAGEPALGPVAFPHRQSAGADPLAPLGHHWQDSTHITFGVVTAGIMTRWAKLEGSWFNGREPDEGRYDFDLRPFDSYSTRVSVNPSSRWSLQASYGFLESPEELHPDVSVQRYTTSATHAMKWGEGRTWATTAALGINNPSEGDLSHGLLLESSIDLARWGISFVRYEHLLKGAEEFGIQQEGTFSVNNLVVGHVHALPHLASIEPALGVRASLNVVDENLEARYGTRVPFGVMAYLRVAPMKM
jgi:hypothetical protein